MGDKNLENFNVDGFGIYARCIKKFHCNKIVNFTSLQTQQENRYIKQCPHNEELGQNQQYIFKYLEHSNEH